MKVAISIREEKNGHGDAETDVAPIRWEADVQEASEPLSKETSKMKIVSQSEWEEICQKIRSAGAAWARVVAELDSVLIQSKDKGETLLHAFAGEGSRRLTAYLLEAGVPVDAQSVAGYTAIDFAIAKDDLADCKLLCDFGATINPGSDMDKSPLVGALMGTGHLDIALWLFQHPRYHRQWDDWLFTFMCRHGPSLIAPYLNLFAVGIDDDPSQRCHVPKALSKLWDPSNEGVGYFGVYYLELAGIYGLPHVPVASTALAVMLKTPFAREALATRTMRNIIQAKWWAFGRSMFRQEVVTYTTLVVAFSVSIVFDQAEAWNGFDSNRQFVVGICRIVAGACSSLLLLRVESREALVDGPLYFFSFWNLLGASTYVGVILVVVYQVYGVNSELIRATISLLTVTLWVNVFQYLQMVQSLAVLIAMMSHMVNDVAKFILLYSIFLFGFSGGFYVLLFGNSGYETFIDALITVLLMLFGQITYDTFHAATGLTWVVSNLLLLAYLVSVVIVLLNLLIAMMSTSYSNVWEEAEGQVLLSYAQAIVRMEKSLTKADRVKQFEGLKCDLEECSKKRAKRIEFEWWRKEAKKAVRDSTTCVARRMARLLEYIVRTCVMVLTRPFVESHNQSDSPLARNLWTSANTLDDGERWERKRKKTASDEQTELRTRVDKLTSLVEQQTALIKEQTAANTEQAALITKLHETMRALVGRRGGDEASQAAAAPQI